MVKYRKRLLFVAMAVLLILSFAGGNRQTATAAQPAYMYGGWVGINGPGGPIGSCWYLSMNAPAGFYTDTILVQSPYANPPYGYAWGPGIPTDGFSILGNPSIPDYGTYNLYYNGNTFFPNAGWQQSAIIQIFFIDYSTQFSGGISYQWTQDYGCSGGSGGQYNSAPQNHWCGSYWGQCDLGQPQYFYGSCGWYYGYCDYYAPYYFAWDYYQGCYCIYAGTAYQYGQYQSDDALNDDSLLTYAASPPKKPANWKELDPGNYPGAPKWTAPKGHEHAPSPLSRAAFERKLRTMHKGDAGDTAGLFLAIGPNAHFDAPQPTTPEKH